MIWLDAQTPCDPGSHIGSSKVYLTLWPLGLSRFMQVDKVGTDPQSVRYSASDRKRFWWSRKRAGTTSTFSRSFLLWVGLAMPHFPTCGRHCPSAAVVSGTRSVCAVNLPFQYIALCKSGLSVYLLPTNPRYTYPTYSPPADWIMNSSSLHLSACSLIAPVNS